MKKNILFATALVLSAVAFATEVRKLTVPEGFGSDGRFTVAMWVYIPGELGPLDAKGFGVKGFCFASRGFREQGVQFYLGEDKGKPEFKFFVKGKRWYSVKSEQSLISTEKWFHIAGVRDSGTMRLYLNGELVSSAEGLPPAPEIAGAVNLCGLAINSGFTSYRFPGYLEKCLFEPIPLTGEEIKRIYLSECTGMPESMPSIRSGAKPDLDEKLPIVREWEKTFKPAKDRRRNCEARVVRVGGRPRLELNGKVTDATLMLPHYPSKNEIKTKSIRDFAAAGVKFYMDIFFTTGKLNKWWLGEGKYDFDVLDERIAAILDGAPDGYVIPRFKLDPPQWWREANPDEMLGAYAKPYSKKWHALFVRMLRDVVSHMESSSYANRIVGYNYGAYVGGEWIWRTDDEPKVYDPEYWKRKADVISEAALLAGHTIKEVTGGKKLTGVFFGYPLGVHGNLMQLVNSPDIDFFCSPISYNGRRAGEPGRFSTNYQATYRLHNKLYWNEADERTEFSEYTGLWHPDWHHLNSDETRGAMERDLGWALTSGHEIWWFAIAGKECFHDERIIQTVKRGVELCNSRPDIARKSEIAIFSPVWYAPDPAEHRQKEKKSAFLNYIVPTCGVPIDSYELADLSNPDLPEYKAAIVITGTHGEMPSPSRKGMKLLVVKNESELPGTAEALRNWCSEMGAHVWNTGGDVFGAGCGFAFIHAVSDGKKTVTFPNGRIWEKELKAGQTEILRLDR